MIRRDPLSLATLDIVVVLGEHRLRPMIPDDSVRVQSESTWRPLREEAGRAHSAEWTPHRIADPQVVHPACRLNRPLVLSSKSMVESRAYVAGILGGHRVQLNPKIPASNLPREGTSTCSAMLPASLRCAWAPRRQRWRRQIAVPRGGFYGATRASNFALCGIRRS